MIAVRNPDVDEDVSEGQDLQARAGKITEVYTTRVPKLSCVRRWFAAEILEMDFAEDFETSYYNPEESVGKRGRKMCCYRGSFSFAPDVEVTVYEGDRFARIYLKYDNNTDPEYIDEVRTRVVEAGLERRLLKVKKKE